MRFVVNPDDGEHVDECVHNLLNHLNAFISSPESATLDLLSATISALIHVPAEMVREYRVPTEAKSEKTQKEELVDYDPMGTLDAMMPRWIKERTPLTITMRDRVQLDGIITRADPMQVGTGYIPNTFVLLSPNPADCGIDMDNAMDMYIRMEEIAHIGVRTQS